MQIYIVSVGKRMPAWLLQGYQDFAGRLPAQCRLKLIEVPPIKRGKQHDPKAIDIEGERLLAAIPKNCLVFALDVMGKQWSSEQLATELDHWLHNGQDVALLIGGADGLSAACKQRAQRLWSLSELTFPHMLMRVMLAEQLYRAWSLLNNHPYHRAG